MTDTTGKDNNLFYYCEIVVKDGTNEYMYDIQFKNESSFWRSDVKSEINLIGAFDMGIKRAATKLTTKT